jgi:hypothetical protein
MTRYLAFALILGFTVGCGGGSGGPFGMWWDDDGTAVKFIGGSARFTSSGGTDSYDIDAVADLGSVELQVTAPSPIAPQTFVCNQTTTGQLVGVTYYWPDGGIEFVDQSCTVVLTKAGQVGDTAVGTFEAVITLQAGGTKTISNGKFNLHVSTPI